MLCPFLKGANNQPLTVPSECWFCKAHRCDSTCCSSGAFTFPFSFPRGSGHGLKS
jgi:hypothetical protein